MFVTSLSGKTDEGRRELVQKLAYNHCFICDAREIDLALTEMLPSYTVRWVVRSQIRARIDGHVRDVTAGRYIIANPMQPVRVETWSPDARVLVISITSARMREVFRAMRESSQRIFHDNTPISQWPVRFHSRSRMRHNSVLPLLDGLFRVVDLGVHDNRWLEEQYGVLAERLLFDEYRQSRNSRSLRRSGALQERLRKTKDYMDKHFDEPLTLNDLARFASVSPHHFLRSFKKLYATTPHRYLIDCRLHEARKLLRTTDLSVSAIGTQVGFISANGFHSAFRIKFECSPASCRGGPQPPVSRAKSVSPARLPALPGSPWLLGSN